MQIIVFSWVSRTGKSTAITTLSEKFQQQGKTVKIYPETAQIYIDNNPGPITDRYSFQRHIVDEEIKRLQEIQTLKSSNTYDIVLIDRTFADMFVYIYRGIIHDYIQNPDLLSCTQELSKSKELYDEIIFFDTMIIEDKNFADYNNDDINTIFKHTLNSIYQDKIKYYPNNTYFEKNIDIFIKKYMK